MENNLIRHYLNNYSLDEKEITILENNIDKLGTLISEQIQKSGRIIFVSVGSSATLIEGLVNDIEYNFSIPRSKFVILNGGQSYSDSVEDWLDLTAFASIAVFELHGINFNSDDIMIGISSSGRTSYVKQSLKYARDIGCKTALLTNNYFDIEIDWADTILSIGFEKTVTNLRSFEGITLMKLMLDSVIINAVYKAGRIYKNELVFIKSNSKDSLKWVVDSISNVTSLTREESEDLYLKSNNHTEIAIIRALMNVSFEEAVKILQENNNNFNKIFNK